MSIGDPTVSGEAKDSSIYCEMPLSEMIDTLSEQDLQQFTLDHWIELYAKARKLKEAKVYKYKKPGRERVSSVEHTIKYKDIEATPGVPWMDRRIINEFIFYLINGYEIWESKGRQNYNLVNYEPNTGYWFIPDKGYYSASRGLILNTGYRSTMRCISLSRCSTCARFAAIQRKRRF